MRIGEISKDNYAQFMKMLGGRDLKTIEEKMQSTATTPKFPSINPYAKPGQDITNRTDWRKMTSISDEVKNKLLSIVKSDFVNHYGMSGENFGDPNGYNSIVTNYLSTLLPSERPSASWTLSKTFTGEAQRLTDIVRAHNPGWEFGQPFDTSILDESTASNRLNVKV